MRICFGWSKTPLNLSSERRYQPEELQLMFVDCTIHDKKLTNPLVSVPLWVHMDGEYIRLTGKEQLSLACQLICVYHNGPDCKAPPDDGWDMDTIQIEEKAAQHMLVETSDEGTDVEVE